ncbi:hypothetical protein DL98DRAFT_569805 [Cadophora sp. DSE1049]|nr:hypothetical protein DL98DRAFT_569805 [Cadophora sp. DSE1049]
MARKYLGMLFLLLLHITTLVHAIPWQEAPSTTPSQLVTSTATLTTTSETPAPPLPTPPPQIVNGPLEAPNICGYVNHDSLNPYTCAPPHTCLWTTSPHPLVGCGVPTSITFHTSCIPYRLSSSCSQDSTCVSAPSILHCPSELPHCATARVGPGGNYSIRACQANPAFGKVKVELDYVGQSVLGHLPRWLEEGGEVRLGTVTPMVTSSSTGRVPFGSNGEVNPATIPGGVFTVIVSSSLPRFGEGGGKHCNSTCRAEKYEAQERKQILAGGLVGGFYGAFWGGVWGLGCLGLEKEGYEEEGGRGWWWRWRR